MVNENDKLLLISRSSSEGDDGNIMNNNNNDDIVRRRGRSNSISHGIKETYESNLPMSPWFTSSTTPMTTRPHFERHPHSPQGRRTTIVLRRVRSRSLGSVVERNHRVEDFRNLLLPSIYNVGSSPSYDAAAPWIEDDEEYQNGGGQQQQPATQLLTPQQKKPATPETVDSNDTSSEQQQQGSGEIIVSDNIEDKNKQKVVVPIKTPAWICILYGLINATIVLPVLMSFGAIIYRDEAFSPYMPVLVKLTLVSGIVHQLCFSTFSSLPFAVGQVQDAGLIFLSSMASFMVQYCRSLSDDDETMLATVTIGLSLCTALLGLGLILVGRLKLAQYVQMLPTCVVGGYLAYIGWFCGVSGVGIMAGSSEVTFKLVSEKLHLVLPGILGGIFIYASVCKLRHMAVLPTCILLLLVLFYVILFLKGSSIEEATEQGWIRKMEAPPVWYHSWDYLRFDKVIWSALPKLALTQLSMIFVVALSSSLDVAAIELEMQTPLNYNHELSMVGISNLVSGLTGGYTGSYIFSQSIFSLRAGIRNRLAGYVLAISQIVVLILPFPILSYIPNFFFGSLLSMICADLCYEWLWDVRSRVTPVEYIICLATFGCIQFLGVEYGILAGVIMYMVCRKLLGVDVGEGKIMTSADFEMDGDNDEDVKVNDDAGLMTANSTGTDNGGEAQDSHANQYGSILMASSR